MHGEMATLGTPNDSARCHAPWGVRVRVEVSVSVRVRARVWRAGAVGVWETKLNVSAFRGRRG